MTRKKYLSFCYLLSGMESAKNWIALLCLTGIVTYVTCDMYYDLVQKLSDEYDPGLRPICGETGTTDVKIDVALRQILFLHEPTQEIKMKVWMRYFWNDCRLTWNKTDFKADLIHLPMERIWTPDISLFDSTSDETFPGMKDYRVKIQHDGSILYQFPTVITSYCKLNVEYFPVDSQVCELVFTPWIHNGAEVRVAPYRENGDADIDNYQENPGWIMNSFKSKQTVNYYQCCPQPYIELRYYLHIKRRHLNFTITLVFPCILISFLPLIGFLIPVEYGEKVSLQVTIMLSLAVFLTVMNTTLPPSSDAMPLLGMYFAFSLTLVGVSCALTIGVINIHFKAKGHVSARVKKYMFGTLAKVLMVDIDVQSEAYSPLQDEDMCEVYDEKIELTNTEHDNISSSLSGLVRHLRRVEMRTRDRQLDEARAQEWRILATIVDRILFVFFFLFMFVSLLIVFPY